MVARSSVNVVFVADSAQMERALQTIGAQSEAAAGKIDKVGEAGERSGRRGATGFAALNDGIRATGQNIGPLGEGLEHVSLFMERVGEEGVKTAQKIQAVGLGLAALGGIALAAGMKDEQATANLKNSIENSGHTMEEYEKQIKKTSEEMANFGHKSYEVEGALAKLTTATNDPQKALDSMGLAANMAAKEHISLGDAVTQLTNVYAGKFKGVASILGTQYHDLVDPVKELTKATVEQAHAADLLSAANQRLSDFQARIADQQATRSARAAEQVAADTQRSADAETHLSDLRQNLADKHAKEVETAAAKVTAADQRVADLEQKVHDSKTAAQTAEDTAAQHLADVTASQAQSQAASITAADTAVTASHDNVLAAEQRLEDLRARIADRQKTTLSETYALASAEDAVAKIQRDHAAGTLTGIAYTDQLKSAEDRLAQTRALQAEKSQTTLSEQQQLQAATESKAKADDAAADAEAKRVTAGQQTLAEQVAMRQAVEAQTKAQENLQKSMSESTRLQTELVKAVEKQAEAHKAATTAGHESRTEHEQMQKAVEAVAHAHAALQAAQAAEQNAGKLSVSQLQEERKLHEGVTKAMGEQSKAAADMAKAEADKAAYPTKIDAVLKALGDKTKNAAEAEANTTKGMIDKFLAQSDNLLAEFGQKYGGAVTAFGVGLVAVSSLVGSGLASSFVAGAGALGTFIADMAAAVAQAAIMFVSMAADAAVWAAGMLAAGIEALLPFAPIILIVAAVALAAYELYKHWDQVWGFIKEVTQVAWTILKEVFGFIVHLGFEWVQLELKVLSTAWHAIWSALGDAVQWVWNNVLQPVFGFFGGAFDGLSTALYGFWQYVEKAWGGISSLFRTGVNDLIGFVNFLIRFWDSISFSFPGIKIPIPGVPDVPGFNFALPHIDQIPQLAEGGIVNRATLAVIGEAGPEAVIPLSKMGGAGGGDTHIHVHLDGALVTDNAAARRAGWMVADGVHEALLRKQTGGADLMLAGRR